MRAQQIQTFPHADEPAQREAVNVEPIHGDQIILVPLDYRAIWHRGIRQTRGLEHYPTPYVCICGAMDIVAGSVEVIS